MCEPSTLTGGLDDTRSAALARRFKALSDPARVRLLSLIAADPRGEACVCDLNDALQLSQPTISHHLKQLFQQGLLSRRKEGAWVYYRANPAALDELADAVRALHPAADAAAPDKVGSAARLAAPHAAPRIAPRTPSAGTTEHVLRRGADDLGYRFRGIFAAQTIDRYVHESYQTLYSAARVKTHLPVLAIRFATDRLLALAQATGAIAKPVPEILFVCTHNAGRSQLAAALLTAMAPGRVHVRSAGSQPADRTNPAVVEALAEVGIDAGEEFPKPLTDDVVRAADVVITMGCGDACPLYPGKRYLDWDLPDPGGRPLAEVRNLRDQIAARLRSLLAELDIHLDEGDHP